MWALGRFSGSSKVKARHEFVGLLNAPSPGVTAPHTELLARSQITGGALTVRGFSFSLLLRSPGYHMGEHFAFVQAPADLAARGNDAPRDEILGIAYLAARSPDGSTRKYRALIGDGAHYPVYLAISRSWKIHYYYYADVRDK